MKLDVLTLEQCQRVRLWRNQCLETLRTPYPLTEDQQAQFYRGRVCNPNSPHRYWAILNENPVAQRVLKGEAIPADIHSEPPSWDFIGMGGLTYIQWENRLAEISLILDPSQRGKGLGEQAVDLLLEQAFDRLGLKTVCGEVYGSNGDGVLFWSKIAEKYKSVWAILPNRKFWKGEFWDGRYFSIDADDWRRVHGKSH